MSCLGLTWPDGRQLEMNIETKPYIKQKLNIEWTFLYEFIIS